MTQEQRTDVWSRRDQLSAQLNANESTEENADALKLITGQIEACNQELISNTFNPPQKPEMVEE